MSGRLVLVTGAASGIGRATAEMMAAEGARLALFDRQQEELQAVASELGAVPILVDLLDHAMIPGALKEAAGSLGGLDCLINAAGVAQNGSLADLEEEEWNRVIAINLTAPYHLCRASLPYLMRSELASIVNVASGVAFLPTGLNSAYAASKGGLVSFTRALAMELAPGIRVNAVCPGVVDTPMVAEFLHNPKTEQAMLARYALKRPALAPEIAKAIVFLASCESSFVTGSTLAVDGGRTFH